MENEPGGVLGCRGGVCFVCVCICCYNGCASGGALRCVCQQRVCGGIERWGLDPPRLILNLHRREMWSVTHTRTHTHVAWRGVQTVLAVFLASSSVARTKKAFHIPGLASPPPIFFSPPVVSFSCFPFSPSPHRLLFSSSSVSRSCSFSLTSLHPSILSYPSPPSLEANSSNSTSIKRRLSPIPPSGYNFLAFAPSSLWPCRPG